MTEEVNLVNSSLRMKIASGWQHPWLPAMEEDELFAVLLPYLASPDPLEACLSMCCQRSENGDKELCIAAGEYGH